MPLNPRKNHARAVLAPLRNEGELRSNRGMTVSLRPPATFAPPNRLTVSVHKALHFGSNIPKRVCLCVMFGRLHYATQFGIVRNTVGNERIANPHCGQNVIGREEIIEVRDRMLRALLPLFRR